MSVGAAVTLLADRNADPTAVLRLPISAFNAYDSVYASRFLPDDRQGIAVFRIHQATGIPLEQWPGVGAVASHVWEDEVWDVSREHPGGPVSRLARKVYEIATTNLLAFVVGHEISHGYNKCPFAEPPFVVVSGLLKALVETHLDRDIFPDQPLNLSEIRADICAARTVEVMDAWAMKRLTAEQAADSGPSVAIDAIAAMGRRIAIDQAGWLLTAGLKAEVRINTHQMQPLNSIERALFYQDRPADGYLRTPFRLLLFAKTLQNSTAVGKRFVDACDERFSWSMSFIDCPECANRLQAKGPPIRAWLPDCGDERARWLTDPDSLFHSNSKLPDGAAIRPRPKWPANAADILPKGNYLPRVSADLGALIREINANDVDAVRARLASSPALAIAQLPEGTTTLLHIAARAADSRIAALLLDAGALPQVGWRGDTVVMAAAARGNAATVRLLAQRTVGVNVPDRAGNTPLSEALNSDSAETVEALLGAGADPNLPNRMGELALTSAVQRRQAEIMRLLLSNGAFVNKGHPDGNSAIHFAVLGGEDEITALVLRAGADANRPNRIGKTPIHLAAITRQAGAVKLLLQSGADPNTIDLEQSTPLIFAAAVGDRIIVEMLLSHGASRDQVNSTVTTPLLIAIQQGYDDLAELLVTKRAAVLADANGRTPLREALEKGNMKLAALLREYGAR